MAKKLILTLILITSLQASAKVGSPCGQDQACSTGEMCVQEFKNGYCVKYDCSHNQDCGSGAICAEIESENFTVCLKACTKHNDCRLGYQCEEGVCI